MAINLGNTNGGGRSLADINITPLCDVLLVLLIIFMITAPLLSQGIDVNLPQTKAPEITLSQKDIVLTMKQNGPQVALFLGDGSAPITIPSLENQLKATFATMKQKDLFLKADREIRYGEVAKVMAIAKLAGVERIGMMTQPDQP